jgi:hypothetical protein
MKAPAWLSIVAPTIATILGGPLAGLAVESVARATGLDTKTVTNTLTSLDSGTMTSDDVAKIKLAELDLQEKLNTMGLDADKLAYDDKASARTLQATTRSVIPATLAIGITIGFFGILSSLMLGYTKPSNELMIMLGSLSTSWTGVISFYFGSSASSDKKTDLLHQSTPTTK